VWVCNGFGDASVEIGAVPAVSSLPASKAGPEPDNDVGTALAGPKSGAANEELAPLVCMACVSQLSVPLCGAWIAWASQLVVVVGSDAATAAAALCVVSATRAADPADW
jgi:hypothetical protein